ncbi:CGNR zinc finger domain-containing protein [Actinophytocola sediminis]
MTGGTRVLTHHDGQRFTFDPGSFAMELLLTGGPGPYAIWEILHEPADLASWLTESRLTATAPLAAADFHITPADLARIREFRDCLWGVTEAVIRGDRPADADLLVINDGAARRPVPLLDPATMTSTWRTPVHGDQVLGAAAADAIEVLADAPRGRLRQCAATNCRLVFVDTSRPGNRRWCSMQRCGNRAKVAAHRTRS